MIAEGTHETVAIDAEDEADMTSPLAPHTIGSRRFRTARGFPLALAAGLALQTAAVATGGAADGADAAIAERHRVVLGRVQQCFMPPAGTEGTNISVVVRFTLAKDGSLDGRPVAVSTPSHPLGAAFAKAAVRAVETCAPYRLPPEEYASWKTVEATFNAGRQN